MKKRIRKKLHKGEFTQYGMSFFIEANNNNAQERLKTITEVADNHNVFFIGGGFGIFTMLPEKYGDFDVPKKIEDLIFFVALSNSPQIDGIIGYFINPTEKAIDKNTAEKIKSELENTLQAEFKINLKVDLWNR
ncbi:hypothetical protein FACS189434_12310 [Bacteroidia bacterium]|nr:hypothetical protein FACS189434_12310 [Bacteroidia bacterium]